MRTISKAAFAVACLSVGLLTESAAPPAQKPDFAVTGVELFPYPLTYQPPGSVDGDRAVLHQSGSTRVIVTIENRGGAAGSFNVAARATLTGVGENIGVKNGPTVELGKCRVGSLGFRTYACFDVFPGEARAGDHDIHFVVDADGEIDEANEANNVIVRRGRFVAPGK